MAASPHQARACNENDTPTQPHVRRQTDTPKGSGSSQVSQSVSITTLHSSHQVRAKRWIRGKEGQEAG